MNLLSSLTKKDLVNKICLLRVDLNIQQSQISADINVDKRRKNQRKSAYKIGAHPRILAVLPTIKFLIKNKAKVVILSHRGRPATQISADKTMCKSALSLRPFAKILSSLLKKPVCFIDFNSLSLRGAKRRSKGNIFLLENLRFFDGEEKNDKQFAKKLASLGDIYINDAFAVSHRANASVAFITKFLPSYAGLLLEKEIKNLDKAMKNPKRPLIVILGGAKISDKIGVIENFFKKADYFLIGGVMANIFLAGRGLPIGLLRRYSRKIILPIDTVVYKRQILDIGPKTIEKYSKIIENARTIIWNGPMGYIEDKKFRKGSEAIAKAIIKSKSFSVIGGGETTSLFQSARINADQDADKRGYNIRENLRRNLRKSAIFVSTGGGAMLKYLAGKKLPGLTALK